MGEKKTVKRVVKKVVKKKDISKEKTTKNTQKITKRPSKTVKKGGFFSGLGLIEQQKKEIKKEVKKEISQTTAKTLDIPTKKQSPIMESVSKVDKKPTRNATIVSREDLSSVSIIRRDKNKSTESNVFHKKQTTHKKSNKNISFSRNQRKQKKSQKKETTNQPKMRREKKAKISDTLAKKSKICIGSIITVKELSEKMGVPVSQILMIMLQNKILGGINTAIDFDTASLIATDFEVEVKKEEEQTKVDYIISGNIDEILKVDKDAETLIERPPIVTVMGHVDHGKTSLLDYLRKTKIADGEAGGITQSIGASMIEHNGKPITFIDTPGHELFTSLRARGAKITNIAVIVIAADDGIKPQTVESINHAKEAGVQIIIAITKMDKAHADNIVDKVKGDLGQYELIPEDRGGDVPVVPISSYTGQGIDDLLEQIILHTEMLELKYNPNRKGVGIVIDAKKDSKKGISTSIIVLTGTMKVGDVIVVKNVYGKIKRITNASQKIVKKATGGDPIQILGLQDIPEPGRVIEVVKNEKEAQSRIQNLQNQTKNTQQSTLQKFLSEQGEGKTLKIILKSDGPSSLEALGQAVNQINLPETVDLKIIHNSIGIISDSDISLAQASDALVIGFNSSISASIKKKADQLKIDIKNFNIIYELVEYIEDVLNGLIEIEKQEVDKGKLEVLGIFYKKEKMMVIGGKVKEGKALNGAEFKVIRNDAEIGRGKVESLQKENNSVKEIATGHECGMKIKSKVHIEKNDILEFFMIE